MSSAVPIADGRARQAYGPSAGALGVGALAAGTLLAGSAVAWQMDPLIRSVSLGTGLVALSTAATALVSVMLYRIAPAATAPALALLYLLKVLAMGWFLVNVGAPAWLHAVGFAVAVAGTVVVSWAGLLPVTARASRILGEEYAVTLRAQREAMSSEAGADFTTENVDFHDKA